MHILATFATLCCQTRWPRNHSCTTQEHVSFFRTFSGTRQKPTGPNLDIFELFRLFRLFRKTVKNRKTVQKWKIKISCSRMFAKKISHVHKSFCTCSKTQFTSCSQTSANVQMHKCANLQMCKNRRAQNAQICSANIFPNAEITNSQICTVHNFVCASFRQMCNFFFCVKCFCAC